MGEDGEDGEGRHVSDPTDDSDFNETLSQDRQYEKSVRFRMFITWLTIFVVIALWFVVERTYR